MLIQVYSAYIDFFASAIILIIFLGLIYKKAYVSISGRNLIILAILIFLLTLFEGHTYLLNNSANPLFLFLHHVFIFLLYILTPLLLGFWVRYTYFLSYERQADRKHLIFFFLPTIIVVCMVVINLIDPFIYSIDENGVYTRLIGYIYISGISYLLVVYALIVQLIVIITKREYKIVILFISNIIAFFGSFIQLRESDNPSFYTFITIGFVIIFVFFESIEDRHDQLTKMFNRRKIYEILELKISLQKPFSVAMFDLDNLKVLNDNYGHHVGDCAILHFSNNLKQKFDRKGILGRVGGDEFLLVTELNHNEISTILDSISPKFTHEGISYDYGFSYGISNSEDVEQLTVDLVLKHADQKMYTMKAKHKNYKRRKTD